MSNPCTPDSRPIYHSDYTESMQTDTLLKIRTDLMKNNSHHYPGSWESKRLRRINQVLRDRGLKNLHL